MSKKKSTKAEASAGAPAPAPRARAKSYKIAMGSSLCGCRHILSDGDDVSADMLHPNPDAAQRAFDAHLESGIIVEA